MSRPSEVAMVRNSVRPQPKAPIAAPRSHEMVVTSGVTEAYQRDGFMQDLARDRRTGGAGRAAHGDITDALAIPPPVDAILAVVQLPAIARGLVA